MNSIWIVLVVALWMFLGYRIYGKFLESKLNVSDRNKTPAILNKKDKVDYSPANRPFLLGHHFSSIAGAGPIIGPILAVSYFGWLPVVLWVSIGSVFIGAMHDYVTLIVSVRNNGKGIATIAEKTINSKAGWIFGAMIWLTLMLVIVVFSVSSAESIVQKPDLIIPICSIIFISLILGIGVQKYKWDYKIATVVALLFIFLSVWIGAQIPLSIPVTDTVLLKNIWITLIMVYAGISSILPVWILLRPRDYISSLSSILVILLGIIAVIIVRPLISAPAYQSSSIFPLWPILFITVACGAISGFHGLVSSGITSKQLSKESHGRSIGYGGMLLEATLAIFVTLVVSAGVSWQGSNSFQEILKQGWIVLFSTGYGNIVSQLGIPFLAIGVASLLGALIVNQFILTTTDASVRIGRFVFSEALVPKLKNRLIATLVILVPAWLIAVTNTYDNLWRLFGSSNQLIASISLITVAAYLVSKKINVKFVIIPALFVLVTTISALLWLTFNQNGYFFVGNYLLTIVSSIMVILGIIVSFEGFRKILKK